MGMTWVNPREVDYIPSPSYSKMTMSDIDWVCDKCGKTAQTFAKQRPDGGWESANQPAPGWRELNFNLPSNDYARTYFCSFACEIDWLAQGDWRPLLRAEIEDIRKIMATPDQHQRSSAQLGDALTVALP